MQRSPAVHACGALRLVGGCTWCYNNVGGVTADQAPHNSNNVGVVTAGQVGHTSCVDSIYQPVHSTCKIKWSWAGHIKRLGDHMTGKDDKGDQLSGGETTWTNSGVTRYGRGQHKTG